METVGYLCAFIVLLGCLPNVSNCVSSRSSKVAGLMNSSVEDKNICQAKELYFDVNLDHFGFAHENTFKLRYYLGDQHWNKKGGPILFYTGNEGNVDGFCKNTGFMWDLAPEFGAMVVFAEHRYYGKSLPFGKDTFKNNSNLNWLTTDQALADYAELIQHLKETIPGAQDSHVIAFGGSYGGLLSAFMRISYPHVVVGSLAAAAPIVGLSDTTKPYIYYDVLTSQYERVSKQCVKNIRQGFDAVDAMAREAGGFELLANTFNLCTAPSNIIDLYKFHSTLILAYQTLELMEYPYPSDFMEPLPAYPVEVACGFLSEPMEGDELVRSLARVTNLVYNYTGSHQCLDFKTPPGAIEKTPWLYQCCTEIILQQYSNGSGLIPPIPINPKGYSDYCYRTYGVRPRPQWAPLQWRTRALDTTSNIIFSNGVLDPTIAFSLTHNVSDTVIAINIKDGAHHTELRSKTSLDPPSVTVAREQIVTIFKQWLNTTTL